MYFQDLSNKQLHTITEALRLDDDVCIQNTIKNRIELKLSYNKLMVLQDEQIDHWMNCNNNKHTVINCLLHDVYK